MGTFGILGSNADTGRVWPVVISCILACSSLVSILFKQRIRGAIFFIYNRVISNFQAYFISGEGIWWKNRLILCFTLTFEIYRCGCYIFLIPDVHDDAKHIFWHSTTTLCSIWVNWSTSLIVLCRLGPSMLHCRLYHVKKFIMDHMQH